VFGARQYSPHTDHGRRLMAHELTHVTQQATTSPSDTANLLVEDDQVAEAHAEAAESSQAVHGPNHRQAPTLQRKGGGAGLCGGAWTCAASPCEKPDPGREGGGGAASAWTLQVMIDVEAVSAEDVTPSTIGHTYVEFSDSTGAAFTYGFYPDKSSGTPDPLLKPQVAGCMVHPDTNHKSCVDYTETFQPTQSEFQQALKYAQAMCKTPLPYHIQTFNCTSFANEVVKQAGRSLPAIRGKVGLGTLAVTADNPYTLLEGLRDRDVPSRRASSDTEIRNWVSANSLTAIGNLPVAEMIRLIDRLLDGWVSEGDIAAVEKICSAVTVVSQMAAIRARISSRENELNAAQKGRLHSALNRI